MKKQSVMNLLGQLKAESEQKPAKDLEMMPMRIMELLIEYIHDEDIRRAVDEIHF